MSTTTLGAAKEIEELRAELKVAESFHKVAVKERDYERAENERLTVEYLALRRDYEALRRGTDRVKVRAYELGQMELHDLAWSALIGEKP